MSFHQMRGVQYVTVLLFCISCQTMAAGFYDQDDALRLRLRNELRRADKPSAGSAHNIYAWIQAVELEYNSAYLNDVVGVDVGGFYVHRLDAKDNWSSRWYLDGNESFSRSTAAIKVKLADNIKVKAGRMVTDSAYSGQGDIPIINSSSQRAVPTISDAVLVQYSPTQALDVYGMYRYGYYGYSDVEQGVHKMGPLNPNTLTYDKKRAQYVVAGVYHDNEDYYAISGSSQEDVATQVMGKAAQRYPTGGADEGYFKPELIAFYARLNGQVADREGPESTYLLGGQLSYINKYGSVFVGLGKAGPKANRLSGVDTDIGYVFDLSIDRNHSDMWSSQIGVTWNLTPGAFVGIAEVFTNGYEDDHKNVAVHGMGTDVLLGYMPQDGYLKGLRSLLVLNSSREVRNGSALGSRLDYFDIKLTFQYDFALR